MKRTVRTVQRWESTQGLPVHRLVHDKRSTVFAYRSELDDWWQARQQPAPATTEPDDRRGIWIFLAACAVAVVLPLLVRAVAGM